MKIILGCVAALMLITAPASAAEVSLQKSSPDELKAICQKAGASFSTDNSGYGCGTDCKGANGTDCTVFCPVKAKKCTAQVTGARRPKTAMQALEPAAKK